MTKNTLIAAFGALCLVGASGCAHEPPKELKDARAAFKAAEAGPASQEDPAQLHNANKLLTRAEKAFDEHGDTRHTRDLAYIAMRGAQVADAHGRTAQTQRQLAMVEQRADQQRAQELARLREQRQQMGQQQQMSAEQQAQQQTQQVANRLGRVATVKQDDRGMVVSLSGTLLFESGKSELLPGAQARLREVAQVLATQSPDARIIVEGHTDSRGNDSLNLELSARRAEAVANFLAQHGVNRDRVLAQGLGFSRPVADNKTAQGRAANRRVEIVVQQPTR